MRIRPAPAEYVRVLLVDTNAFKVPEGIDDEHALFTTDIFPTGYMAAENANFTPGATIAIWGAGPVGLFAMKSAQLLGAGKAIMIDRVPERLELAREHGAETISYDEHDPRRFRAPEPHDCPLDRISALDPGAAGISRSRPG